MKNDKQPQRGLTALASKIILPFLMSLRKKLSAEFSKAFAACGYDPVCGEVVVSERPDLSQFQCNGALRIASNTKQKPRTIAEAVLNTLKDKKYFSSLSIAGPGFINIALTDSFLAEELAHLAHDSRLGVPKVESPENIIIDFGGPNVAKPMHVGHLRSAIIGDCLQRLFRFLGHHVTSDIHLGDWGTQMGMLIAEFQCEAKPITLETLETLYPQANARCQNDEKAMQKALAATVALQRGDKDHRKLWQKFRDVSVNALKKDFSMLGVAFDAWNGESHYHEHIPDLLRRMKEAGVAKDSEGALVIPITAHDGRDIPPLILVKSDGGYLYGTTDLAALDLRVRHHKANRILYVVDNRQRLHFEQVFGAAREAKLTKNAELEHIAFGTVNGPDGRPFKTREGGVMKLSNLVDMVVDKVKTRMEESEVAKGYELHDKENIAQEISMAALKFGDLVNHRTSDYTFDVNKFTQFEGKTGPYLLYMAVRMTSMLNKASEQGIKPGTLLAATDGDRELMLALCSFPDVIEKTVATRLPSVLCEYAYTLSQSFSRFYEACHILGEKDKKRQASWLSLVDTTYRTLKRALDLLGISIPEKM